MVRIKQLAYVATVVVLGFVGIGIVTAEDQRCQQSLMLVDFVNCDTQQLRWSFNREVRQCVQFLGCNRTAGNNFDKIDDCITSCYVSTSTAVVGITSPTPIRPDTSRCKANLTVNDLTKCDTIQLRWSYDGYLKRCRQIAGCRRNIGNNFDSMDECDYHCSSLSNQAMQGKSCGPIPTIADGIVARQSFTGDVSTNGDFVIFTCTRGKKIDGPARVECREDGKWSDKPKCAQEAPCGAPPDVNGATIISQSYSNVGEIVAGDFVEYRCSKGMKMWGQSYIVCQPGGKWSAQPKCQDLAAQNPQMRCTGRLSLADVSFCQLEVRYTFSAVQQRCLPFWGCPREQGNNFPTEEICKASCENTPAVTIPTTTTTSTTTTKAKTTAKLIKLSPKQTPAAPMANFGSSSNQLNNQCSRPKGPQCLPGVPATHTSCLPDSPALLNIQCVDKAGILDRHNFWRARVDPPAESMPQVRWDENLATTAERWAAQCPEGYGTGAQRSITIGARQWPWTGQNICFASYDQPWTECIDDWASERERWVYGVGPFPADSVVGHYTQMVWADTLFVGCGKAQCKGSWSYVLVCNYGPGGNVKGVAAPNAWAYPYVSRQKNLRV